MRPTRAEGRRVRLSHASTLGRAASRAASARNSSGTLTPVSTARRTSAAYTSSSRSRICTVLGTRRHYMQLRTT